MTVPLKKWGNSLALRIPKDIATTLSIEYNSIMELAVVNGVLILKPQRKSTRLEDLVSQINSQNLHQEVSTGRSVGNEEW
ncbi:Programmed cell death antitoxin MazE [hydrothermal vent metagenome]|uniref:Programmed cell death antitoxin MazE n=1 Tax=hydrothermal vent metagenome TaxID=652676 RepID=A0A1W1CZX7_9ZZZZ